MSLAIAARGTQLQRSPDGGTTYVTIAEVLSIDASGMKTDLADVTNMSSPSAFREFLPTLLDSGEVKFECNFIPADATQASVLADFTGQVENTWKIELPATAGNWVFTAFVADIGQKFAINEQVKTPITLRRTGPVTYTPGS
jgi:hypothetical protein